MKSVKFCPICAAKKIIHAVQLKPFEDEKYDKSSCPTPPMGWSSWNLFRNKINENLIKETADAMADSGLEAAGYRYINIDDCWQDSRRDDNGRIQCDPYTFPSGIKALAEYVNSKNLKLGIYSSNGALTCEDYPASLGHEKQDAESFAEWGIEYFKYDFCHHQPMPIAAPFIVKITFKGENNEFELFAADAFLSGNARLIDDQNVDGGHYIKGLSSRSGSAIFDIEIENEGLYETTFTIRKSGLEKKFMVACVNGKDNYEITAPGTTGWTPEGKVHTEIYLYRGKNTIVLTNPIGSLREGYAYQYAHMGKELKKATKKYAEENGIPEKKIVYSICEWGMNHPWKWGTSAGNLWRTTPDIKPNWLSILAIYEVNVRLGKYAGIGSYNDPDMLEVGNGDLTYEENYSHFALWCMMASPLILGNDIRQYVNNKDDLVYKVLTNKYLIGIDQDPLCVPCKRIDMGIKADVLVRPLSGNRAAICLLNKKGPATEETIMLKELFNKAGNILEPKSSCKIFDIRNESETVADFITAKIPYHGVQVYIAG